MVHRKRNDIWPCNAVYAGLQSARKDHRGVGLISDVLPLGLLWYGAPNAIGNAIEYAKHRSRSHEALPAEVQQSSITQPAVETRTASKAFEVSKRADFKIDIATLLASKSSLKEVILLREILGTPRGLQALDIL